MAIPGRTEVFERQEKTRGLSGRRADDCFRSLASSGHSIRRHGGPMMMMVVTVMAVDLHLHSSYRLGLGVVKELFD
jgi:hypothetical protein